MASVRANVLANFSGKAITGVVVLAVTPIYVRLLGIESYALVGIFAAIQGVLSVLDLGLGATLNRRLAELSVGTQSDAPLEMRDLVRTFEVLYGLIGVLSGSMVAISAHWTARHLLHASALPQTTTDAAVRLMGIAFAFQWPVSLYSGALAGTQRQVLWNGLSVSVSLVRSLGAIAALLFVGRSVEVFFGWQIVMALVNTAACHAAVWQVLPRSETRPRFRRAILSENVRFAGHLAGSSLLAVVITQLDKFLLGSLLPLAELGYYTLATTVSNALYSLIGPVFTATFPRLSQLAAEERTSDVRTLYHKACQLMSLVILPPALVAALFAPQIMLAWTGNPETALHTQRLVPFLVFGTALNGLVNMPYALQLSHGWSRFCLIQNILSAIVVIPLLASLVSVIGALGGALGWFTLNAGYVFIGVPIMHRRLLAGDYVRWIASDVGLPFLAALAVVAVARALLPDSLGGRAASLVALSAVGLLALLAATLATGSGRQTIHAIWVRTFGEPNPTAS